MTCEYNRCACAGSAAFGTRLRSAEGPPPTDVAVHVPCCSPCVLVAVLLRAVFAHVGPEAASSLACLRRMLTGCRTPDVDQRVNSVQLFSAYPLTAEFAPLLQKPARA